MNDPRFAPTIINRWTSAAYRAKKPSYKTELQDRARWPGLIEPGFGARKYRPITDPNSGCRILQYNTGTGPSGSGVHCRKQPGWH